MNPAQTHGAFSWSELMTPDPAAAAAFYSSLLGYSIETMEMDMGTYSILKLGETPAAGVMNLPDANVPPNWGYYVTVDDVDAVAAKAKELGATEVWPLTDIADIGRMSGFLDRQGAYFAIITYSYPVMEGAPEPNFADAFTTHGAFSWFELRSNDLDASKAFYSALFGWTFQDWPTGDDTYLTIKVGEVGIGGMIPLPMPEIPPHWGGYITVENSDAIADAATAAGGTIHVSMDIPTVGRINVLGDPQGAMVSVITYVLPAAEAETEAAAGSEA